MLYDNIPIFPLKSIVLPGGLFPLRIFERRYIDMITGCMKEEKGFCIALTKTEEPSLYVTDIYEYGSFVKITDWGQLNDGLLSITVEGKNIVKIKKLSVFDIVPDSVAELKLKILFIYGRPVKSHKTCHFQRSEKSILCYRTDIIKIFAYG